MRSSTLETMDSLSPVFVFLLAQAEHKLVTLNNVCNSRAEVID
jgi:hypothetical protein